VSDFTVACCLTPHPLFEVPQRLHGVGQVYPCPLSGTYLLRVIIPTNDLSVSVSLADISSKVYQGGCLPKGYTLQVIHLSL
jgi:hypothetical protein